MELKFLHPDRGLIVDPAVTSTESTAGHSCLGGKAQREMGEHGRCSKELST